MAALRLLRQLQEQDRPAEAEEQKVLARWSGWGAVPRIFDEAAEDFAAERTQLKTLLDEREWRAASRTTLNAHYTDAAIASAMWDTVKRAGFGKDNPTRVLEPGCGAGTFLGLAPDTATALIGVELDPVTAAIAAKLYPHADIRAQSFAETRIPNASIDLVIGNVPFGKVALHDKVHNPNGHSLHNHFILKSLALTRPGGLVACFTSRFTLDARSPAERNILWLMFTEDRISRLFSTSDGGAHWRALASLAGGLYYSLRFFDARHAVVGVQDPAGKKQALGLLFSHHLEQKYGDDGGDETDSHFCIAEPGLWCGEGKVT